MPVNYGNDYRYPTPRPAQNLPQQGRQINAQGRGATGNMTLPGRGAFIAPQYDMQSYYDMLIRAGADPATAYQFAAGRYGGGGVAGAMGGLMQDPGYLAKMANITALAAARPAPPQPVGVGLAPVDIPRGPIYPAPPTIGQMPGPTFNGPTPQYGQGPPNKGLDAAPQGATPNSFAYPLQDPNAGYGVNAFAAPPSPQPMNAMASVAPPMQNGVIQALLQDPGMRQAILQALMMQA